MSRGFPAALLRRKSVMAKRYDKKHRLLRTGEIERADGYYTYRWSSRDGKRHSVTASTLEELREKEAKIQKDVSDGIRADAQNVTVNDLYKLWKHLKRGLKDNTFQNYCYMYDMFVAEDIGKMCISRLKRSDVKRFYNKLADERKLKIATIDNIHTVLHQVLQLAVEDNYVRQNVSDNMLKELKQSHTFEDGHKRALTVPEQELFLNFLANERSQYHHWHPIFTVMLGTGMRVGEVCGLRWEDIDFENGIIDVNHTLVYYNHRDENGCYFNIHTPKTKAGNRQIPMTEDVKAAFAEERKCQELNNLQCKVMVDGYTNFVFINRFGTLQHQGTLNKAIRRIIRDCNDMQLEKGGKNPILLPNFSCHSMRHTFTTRLVEAGVNIKVIQELCGHTRSDVTLDIYTTVTKELKMREFGNFEEKLQQQKREWERTLNEGRDGQ